MPPAVSGGDSELRVAPAIMRPGPAGPAQPLGSAGPDSAEEPLLPPPRSAGQDRERHRSTPPCRKLVSGFHVTPPPPSSSPAGTVPSCSPTSAPRSSQARADPCPLRRRPLSGCRLSRRTVRAVSPVHWPWSPSLPVGPRRLGPPFGGLPVQRDHPTPLVPSSSRPFVLDDYRLRFRRGGREVSPGKNAELRTDSVATTRDPRRILGFAAPGRLTPGRNALRHFAFARFGAAPETSTRRPFAGIAACEAYCPCLHLHHGPGSPGQRPCRRCGVPSVRVPRGLSSRFTSCSAPMPGAPAGRAGPWGVPFPRPSAETPEGEHPRFTPHRARQRSPRGDPARAAPCACGPSARGRT